MAYEIQEVWKDATWRGGESSQLIPVAKLGGDVWYGGLCFLSCKILEKYFFIDTTKTGGDPPPPLSYT
jgi:hypothetical protein